MKHLLLIAWMIPLIVISCIGSPPIITNAPQIEISADLITYNPQSKVILLKGNAKVKQGESIACGNEIQIIITNEPIIQVYQFGGMGRQDSKQNQK